MNERLKELAKQARIQMVSEPRLEEFAGLIIKECVKQHPEWWADANADEWSSGPFHYIPKAMMKHFGVKE